MPLPATFLSRPGDLIEGLSVPRSLHTQPVLTSAPGTCRAAASQPKPPPVEEDDDDEGEEAKTPRKAAGRKRKAAAAGDAPEGAEGEPIEAKKAPAARKSGGSAKAGAQAEGRRRREACMRTPGLTWVLSQPRRSCIMQGSLEHAHMHHSLLAGSQRAWQFPAPPSNAASAVSASPAPPLSGHASSCLLTLSPTVLAHYHGSRRAGLLDHGPAKAEPAGRRARAARAVLERGGAARPAQEGDRSWPLTVDRCVR